MKQGLYQTTNGATYQKQSWNMTNNYQHLDKPTQVFSFKAIFKEFIENSRLEQERVRKVIIQYYLEDNSLKINEPTQRNSGIRQGKYLARGKVPHMQRENAYIMPEDLIVGESVYIYGTEFQILDCDDFTRNFYAQNFQIEQSEEIEMCKDNFETQVLDKFKMKDYYGKKSWVNNNRVKSQKQFYALDNKLLKLFLRAKDNNQEYLMVYFLADDSIEIKVYNTKIRCKDLHMTYLKRRKVPANFEVQLPGLNQYSIYTNL